MTVGIAEQPWEGALSRGVTQDFPTHHRAPFPVATDIGILSHTVDQRSDCPAAETVNEH